MNASEDAYPNVGHPSLFRYEMTAFDIADASSGMSMPAKAGPRWDRMSQTIGPPDSTTPDGDTLPMQSAIRLVRLRNLLFVLEFQ
jgi:hypothetical protein